MIDGYFNRFDPAKEYESHLFRAGYVLQSAELNEIQYAAAYRARGIADALFRDGDVVRDARVIVNESTGAVTCESGAVYLQGAVRGAPTATFTIATVGIVAIGLYLQSSIITELEDPTLRDPATLVRNYMEPGAARQKLHVSWGFFGDQQAGDFFPVYTVEDGQLRAKEPPPNLDAVTQALARYDRDSSGGTYVVSGLSLKALDDAAGNQVYSVGEGRARVGGYGVELPTSRRTVYAATPDLLAIASEPHISTAATAQRITLDRTPATAITAVSITKEVTDTLTHGGFTGAQDPLPQTSVLQIIEVKQGGTTYTLNTDYKLTAGKVDWSLPGIEPATGTTYTTKYQYIAIITPTAVDSTGFTVTGAVTGTLVLTNYSQKLPRYDRLTLTAEGTLVWLKGIAAAWNPQPPSAPSNQLSLAVVLQDWGTGVRLVVNDSVRVVPMSELSAINGRIDYMLGLIAQQRLQGDINLREAGQKKGLFVDPLLDDNQRDAGVAQTGAIFNGELTLPVTIDAVAQMSTDIGVRTSLANTPIVMLEQSARTGVMKVNPYQAFDPLPAAVVLRPALDNWTVINTTWASPITQRITVGSGNASSTTTSVSTQLLSSASRAAETLRPIGISFTLSGFGPNEALSSVTFDGVPVTAI